MLAEEDIKKMTDEKLLKAYAEFQVIYNETVDELGGPTKADIGAVAKKMEQKKKTTLDNKTQIMAWEEIERRKRKWVDPVTEGEIGRAMQEARKNREMELEKFEQRKAERSRYIQEAQRAERQKAEKELLERYAEAIAKERAVVEALLKSGSYRSRESIPMHEYERKGVDPKESLELFRELEKRGHTREAIAKAAEQARMHRPKTKPHRPL